MPERISYAHGTPSWIDLSTTDPAAAQAFYSGLFGWSCVAEPTDQGGDYIMASLKDQAVAGMMQQGPEQAEMGLPSMWNSYVTVDDVQAAVGKVGEAGGQVMMPPMDVMTAGKMAVIVDPTGAVICLWEAGDSIGAGLVNEHGALVWNELCSHDLAAATQFYADVFGWGTEVTDMGPENPPYTSFTVGGAPIAGGMAPPMEDVPNYWGIYFASDDVDATVSKAEELGGAVMAPAFDIPDIGRMAVLADPTGAVFSIMSMPPTDDSQ